MSGRDSNKEDFWTNFFGNDNMITAAMIRQNRLTEAGQQYLLRIKGQIDRDLDLPVILPVRRRDSSDSGRVTWYAFVSDYGRFRALGMELRSCLGPSYSDFEPRVAQLDPSDPIEAAVASLSGTHVYRFTTKTSDDESVLRVLNVQYRLWETTPVREWDGRRPTSRVLREFEFALLALDPEAAEKCLAELAKYGSIEAHNLLFMRIRMLSALGRDSEILEMEDLDSLLDIRRPGLVTDAILAALYERYWVWINEIPPFQQLKSDIEKHIRPRYDILLRGGRIPVIPGAKRILVWDQVTRHALNEQRIRELVDSCSDPVERDFLTGMVEVAGGFRPEEVEPEPTSDPNSMLDRGDSDAAFRLALGQTPSTERTALLFRCALDLQTPDSAARALESFAQLQVVDQERLRQHRWFSMSIPLLESQRVGLPESWSDWIANAEVHDRSLALDRLDQALATWTTNDRLMTAGEAVAVSRELLVNRSIEAQQTIVEAVPRLVDFALSGTVESTGIDHLLDSAFDLLSIESDLRLPELNALSAVLEYQLAQGMGLVQYTERIETLNDVWRQIESPLRSSWAISLIGSVTYSPIPSEEAMVRLVAGLTDSLVRMGARLDKGERCLISNALRRVPTLEPIAESFQRSGEETDEEETEWWRELSGKTVGIYSLLEGSTRAATQILHDWLPRLDVRVSHDKVATPALDSLATEADILVISWASAKHAATRRLRSLRPVGLPIVWAAGSGSTSILRALREALDKETVQELVAPET